MRKGPFLPSPCWERKPGRMKILLCPGGWGAGSCGWHTAPPVAGPPDVGPGVCSERGDLVWPRGCPLAGVEVPTSWAPPRTSWLVCCPRAPVRSSSRSCLGVSAKLSTSVKVGLACVTGGLGVPRDLAFMQSHGCRVLSIPSARVACRTSWPGQVEQTWASLPQVTAAPDSSHPCPEIPRRSF